MAEDNTKQKANHSDEIDLVKLVTNLWSEKIVISIATIIIGSAGTLYAVTTPPTYRVSTELSPPSAAELNHLNQTEFFSITPQNAFAKFINIVESSRHTDRLIDSHSELIKEATNHEINDNIFDSIAKKRNIEYPNTNKKLNSLTPDKYLFSYTGIDRQALEQLTINDLTLATTATIRKIEEKYKNNLHLQITKMERKQTLQQQMVDDKLKARKAYVLASRSDRLKRFEEAFKIAKSLNLKSPSSLSRLSEGTGNRQVEINAELNNRPDPLYLRGTKLLNAEIQNLKELDDSIFLDTEIRNLENQKLLLENNRKLEQLKTLATSDISQQEINFFNHNINNPSKPVKPNKTLILVSSLLLGGIVGLFIALIRIAHKKTNAI